MTVRQAIASLRAWPRRKKLLAAAVAVSAAWATAEAFRGVRATIVVVSTSGAPIQISVDGGAPRTIANVAVETPGAGVRIELFAGAHRLTATRAGDGEPEVTEVRLDGGATYLWAPHATEQCFFVEHTAYGRAKPERPPLDALPSAERVWRLPASIDAWFVPTPRPSEADTRSTGGARTVIRQSRCGTTPFR